MDERYVRHEGLFGATGQEKLAGTRVGIAGTGGLGCFAGLELAYLGVGLQTLVDADEVELRNLNRLVWATPADVGRLKVEVMADMVSRILPGANPVTVPHPLQHADAQAALREVDVIFSCLDDDRARLDLIALATAAGIPFFDLATDVISEPGVVPVFGGRVIFSGYGERCSYCMRELDQAEIRRATMTPAELDVEASIYGVPVSALAKTSGPSVVSINGVIASLAVTEFMKFITGLLTPAHMLRYHGNTTSVRRVLDSPSVVPCPYCAAWGREQRGQLRA